MDMAKGRGVAVTRLRPEGGSEAERLASVVGLVDYATVYLALAQGIDPTPVRPIEELKKRLESAGGSPQ
jgi:glucose/mannose-6-phosphate isomerase